MIPSANRSSALSALLLSGALALGGCTHRQPAAAPPPPAAPVAFDQAAAVDAAVAALDRGDVAGARAKIDALLAHDPNDAAARVLKDSLDEDAKALLGPKSFAYKVKAGETMLDLSGRFLGNRLKFYQLARYNDVAVPNALAEGTVLRIPGTPPKAASEKAGPRRPGGRGRPGTSAPAGAAPAAPVAGRTDPAASRAARVAGLAALNQGHVDRAVGQLRRAVALDPANPLARRDLDRAERISRTVKARK